MIWSFGKKMSLWPRAGVRYRKGMSHKIRDFIGIVHNRLKPICNILFPNFIVVHYTYIITVTLITSVLLYPIHNQSYIDILFTSAGAATQGGLNTVATNNLTLYQQIMIYIMCCLATPIFIHGSLAFIRLYWFERYFDNIKYTSKQDFLRRRTMTLQSLKTRPQTINQETLVRENNNYQKQFPSLDKLSKDPNNRSSSNISTSDNILNDSQLEKCRKKDIDTFKHRPEKDIPLELMLKSIGMLQRQRDNSINKKMNKDTLETNDSTVTLDSSTNGNKKINDSLIYVVLPPNEQCSSSNSIIIDNHSSNNNLSNNKTSISKPAFTNYVMNKPFSSTLIQDLYRDSTSYSDISSNLITSNSSTSLSTTYDSNIRSYEVGSSNTKNVHDYTQGKPNELQFKLIKPSRRRNQYSNDEKKKQNRRNKRLKRLTNILSMSPSLRMDYIKTKKIISSTSNIDPLDKTSLRQRHNINQFSTKKHGDNHFGTTRVLDQNMDRTGVDNNSELNEIENSDKQIIDEEINFPRSNTLMSANYVSWEPSYGRNSVFIGLTKEQRNELGGVEYRAIKLLCIILLIYYIGWHICSVVMLIPWISLKKYYKNLLDSEHINPIWWAIFTSMSSYCDLGLTLTNDSMMSFQNAIYVLIILMWFIIIGNTGFPILLRFTIWVLYKISSDFSSSRESLGFLLDHPRRCFTLLFPSAATWWLFLTLVALNFTDWILFIVLDLNSPPISEMPKGIGVLAGLFQAVCTRTAGFNVVDIAALHPSIQVSYMLMMYVSVLPLAISIRRTNVYEEQSLGIYGSITNLEDLDEIGNGSSNSDVSTTTNKSSNSVANSMDNESNKENKSRQEKRKQKPLTTRSFIGAHLRRQLSFDLWYLFLGLFIVCVCESGKIQNPDMPALNVFSILFEIVSAYGTVGLSLGYPGTTTSLSAQFSTISKLVIIAMLVRGRNRGLPYSLDRAIILPTEKLRQIEKIEDKRSKHHKHTFDRSTNSHGDAMNSYIRREYYQMKRNFQKVKRATSMAQAD